MISGMQQQEEAGGADLQQVISGKEEALVFATWDCGSPLYDSFELASLHRVLESHLMVLPFPGDDAASRSRRLERRGGSGSATLQLQQTPIDSSQPHCIWLRPNPMRIQCSFPGATCRCKAGL